MANDPLRHSQQHGYCIFPPALQVEDIARLISALDDVCERAFSDSEIAEHSIFEKDLPAIKRGGVEVGENEQAVFIVGDIARFCPDLLAAVITPDLINSVSTLLGTRDVVLHFTNLTCKTARIGSSISWHRDYPNKYMSPDRPQMLRTMICLDGMDEHNGGTTFVKGSHTDPALLAVPVPEGIEIAICAPGATIAIHPLVLHGGGPNRSGASRRNIVIQWGSRDAPLTTSHRESVTGKSPMEFCKQA